MLERLPDWEFRLAEYLRWARRQPFSYGTFDCALFAAGAVKATTGYDGAAEFRGHYRTMAGSVRALRNIGAGDLEATFDSHLPERPAVQARSGDIVSDGENIGVCNGIRSFFVTDNGIDARLTRDMKKAWSVG